MSLIDVCLVFRPHIKYDNRFRITCNEIEKIYPFMMSLDIMIEFSIILLTLVRPSLMISYAQLTECNFFFRYDKLCHELNGIKWALTLDT